LLSASPSHRFHRAVSVEPTQWQNTCGQKLLTEMHSRENQEAGGGGKAGARQELLHFSFSSARSSCVCAFMCCNFSCILINMQSKNAFHTNKAAATTGAEGAQEKRGFP